MLDWAIPACLSGRRWYRSRCSRGRGWSHTGTGRTGGPTRRPGGGRLDLPQPAGDRIIAEGGDRGVQLVGHVGEAAGGVKGEVTRARAGRGRDGGRVVQRQHAFLRVEAVDDDLIQSQVADE